MWIVRHWVLYAVLLQNCNNWLHNTYANLLFSCSSTKSNGVQSIAGCLRRSSSPFQQQAITKKRVAVTDNCPYRRFLRAYGENGMKRNVPTATNAYMPNSVRYDPEHIFSPSQSNCREETTSVYAKCLRSSLEAGATSGQLTGHLGNHTSRWVNSPLSVWRRRLKTCVQSSRQCGSNSPNADSAEAEENTLSDLRYRTNHSQILAKQHSWSNVTSATGYRMVNQPNNILANICLEGKSPPVQVRPESARSMARSRCSSISNFIQQDTADASEKLLVQRDLSQQLGQIDFMSCEEDNDIADYKQSNQDHKLCGSSREVTNGNLRSTEDDRNEQQEITANSCLNRNDISDKSESFYSNDPSFHKIFFQDGFIVSVKGCSASFLDDENDDCFADDQRSVDSESVLDELEQSDLSENEWSSDDENLTYEGSGQRDMERCKRLYEMENNSRISESEGCHNLSPDKDISDVSFTEFDVDKCDSVEKSDDSSETDEQSYAFADFFPPALCQYNLYELSALPQDVDWRSVIQMSKLFPGPRHQVTCRRNTRAPCKARQHGTTCQTRMVFETVIDRLLVMEKLQTAAIQQEALRRYHSMHRRQSLLRSKSVANKSKTGSLERKEVKDVTNSTSPPTSGRPTSGARRRNSSSRMSMRMAWATETLQGEESLLKRACEDGDLTILHRNWLACCRKFCRTPIGAKRLSDTSKPSTDLSALAEKRFKRHRPSTSFPSLYVYEWSERTKDEKNRSNSSSGHFAQTSSCPTCREHVRKLRRDSSSSQPQSIRPT